MLGFGKGKNRRLSIDEIEKHQATRRRHSEMLAYMGRGKSHVDKSSASTRKQILLAIGDIIGSVADKLSGPSRNRRNDASRRAFLKHMTTAVAVGTAFTIAPGLKLLEENSQRDEANKRAAEILATPKPEGIIPKSYLIPEDERTGNDIIVSVNPVHSVVGLMGYDYDSIFEKFLDPVLSPLAPGTNVHATAPIGQKDEFLDEAVERYPNLNFVVYEMPNMDNLGYMQDIVFSTGSKDENGRFVLASSSLDSGQYARLPKYTPPTLPTINGARIKNLIVDQGEVRDAIGAVILLGDEMLDRDYPKAFNAVRVPVKTEGGDLSITRLPDGGVGLIVGPENLTETIINMANDEAGETKYNAHVRRFSGEEPVGTSKMPGLEFLELLKKARALYEKSFEVDQVIIIDEARIKSLGSMGEAGVHVDFNDIKKKSFFHSDMVVKTATDAKGKPVAFCTHSIQSSERSYLRRVQHQFSQLGYDVVQVPVGYYPATNYVNSQMFTRNGEKVAIVPQYGYPEDEDAVSVYESRGFKVVKTDMSNLRETPKEEIMNIGSLHCRAEILS
ncbi:MAG: hypothetical protein O3B47_03480 [bacterium]|nr:hypothetical protein [bacterium]